MGDKFHAGDLNENGYCRALCYDLLRGESYWRIFPCENFKNSLQCRFLKCNKTIFSKSEDFSGKIFHPLNAVDNGGLRYSGFCRLTYLCQPTEKRCQPFAEYSVFTSHSYNFLRTFPLYFTLFLANYSEKTGRFYEDLSWNLFRVGHITLD